MYNNGKIHNLWYPPWEGAIGEQAQSKSPQKNLQNLKNSQTIAVTHFILSAVQIVCCQER